jgi:hypothetical protein
MTTPVRWEVVSRALTPDGYNDQGYWTGDSFWRMLREYRAYRKLGFIVTVTRNP